MMLNTNIMKQIMTNAQIRDPSELIMANSMVLNDRSHFTVRTSRTTRTSRNTRQILRKDMLANKSGMRSSSAAFAIKNKSNMFQYQFLPMKKLMRNATKYRTTSALNQTKKAYSKVFDIWTADAPLIRL
mmetsp:Transcript_31977/g.66704  ORF Transcript_31977/g.66704 Transcript_31977/m.66704 type:complete len:129 (+) Transcript_31977:945-1331(+)